MLIWITFCAALQLTDGEKTIAKVLKSNAKNSIIFEKRGTLWADVKYGYLRFDVDMNPTFQTVEKYGNEINNIEGKYNGYTSNVEI